MALAAGVVGGLAPAAVHGEDEDVAAVDLFVDDGLGAAARCGEGVFPTKGDETDVGTVAESEVEQVHGVFEGAALDGEVAGGGEEDGDFTG